MNATMKIYYYVGAFIMCFTLIIWMKSNSIQQKLKTRRYRVKQIILNNKLTQKVSGKCILTGVMYTWHNIGVVSFLHFRHLLKWDAKWQIILYVLRQFKCKIIQIKCISDFWRCIVVKLLSVYYAMRGQPLSLSIQFNNVSNCACNIACHWYIFIR